MRYYKTVENGYITSVGTGLSGEEISITEYNNLLSVIGNRPQDTYDTWYRLREDLTWESYSAPAADPDPEIDASEAFEIIFGGAE